MQIKNKLNNILMWGQIVDLFTVAISFGLDFMGVVEFGNPVLYLLVAFGVFAVVTIFRQGILVNNLNEKTPIVSISDYGVEKRKLTIRNDIMVHKEYFAFVEFANNPKFRSSGANAKDVYAKIFFFEEEKENNIILIYDKFEGLWFPYKHNKNVTDKQVKENGTAELLSSGRGVKLMIAQKYIGQDLPVVIENSKDYFDYYPNGGDTEYYQTHFLLHEKTYYALINLFGSRLDEKYIFKLWAKDEKLFFKELEDKKIYKKIISMKRK